MFWNMHKGVSSRAACHLMNLTFQPHVQEHQTHQTWAVVLSQTYGLYNVKK